MSSTSHRSRVAAHSSPGDTFTYHTHAAIDHEAYPHIIDLILFYADVNALARFGLTAKSYAERCHVYATRHLVLADDGGRSLALSSIRGRLGLFEMKPSEHPMTLAARLKQRPQFLRHAAVLDIVGHTGPQAPRLFAPIFGHLPTLRLISRHGKFSRHKFLGYKNATTVIFGEMPLGVFSDLKFAGPAIPPTTKKLVWNVEGLKEAQGGTNDIRMNWIEPCLETAVFIFTNFQAPTEELGDAMTRLLDCISIMLSMSPTLAFKVVDLDLVPLSALNFQDPADTPEERRTRILEYLPLPTLNFQQWRSVILEHLALCDHRELGDRVSFITGKQYRDEVGAAQSQVETCRDLWGCE